MRVGRRVAACALLLITAALGASARSEDGPDRAGAVFDIPAAGGVTLGSIAATYRVTRIEPGGVAHIELRPEFRRFGLPTILEGYYLMVVGTEGRGDNPRLFRARVLDVESPTSARLDIGPEEVGRLRPGESLFLNRPGGSTTAQIEALPTVIPVRAEPEVPATPRTESTGQVAQREASIGNLKRIGSAFTSLYDVRDALPPAVVYGPDGRPWHSWRVLILPFLEEQALYNAYDFRQPWDSATNLKILDKMPAVYRDPAYGDATGHFTHYAAIYGVLGEGAGAVHSALSPPGHRMKDTRSSSFNQDERNPVRLRDVIDGAASTILLAPVSPDRKIPWTKPEDIPFEAGPRPGLGRPIGLAFPYRDETRPGNARVAPLLMVDGSVRLLSDQVDPPTLHALISRDGREVLDPSAMPRVPANPSPPPRRVTVLRVRFAGADSRASVETVKRGTADRPGER